MSEEEMLMSIRQTLDGTSFSNSNKVNSRMKEDKYSKYLEVMIVKEDKLSETLRTTMFGKSGQFSMLTKPRGKQLDIARHGVFTTIGHSILSLN